MIQRLRNRIARSTGEGGFTLIELLVVIIIIGILLAVAVPSYLGFRGRAQDSKAQANVRAAVPAVEAYFADNIGATTDPDGDAATTGYTGMNTTRLRAIDSGLSTDIDVQNVTQSSYCIDDDSGGADHDYFKNGPSANIVAGAC